MTKPAAPARVLVGVAGSIAAYKAADVVSGLRKRGAEVTVLMTRAATHFASPLALKVLSGRPVGVDLFDEPAEWGVGHVSLAKQADVYVVVGATADLLAKLALGLADDFVSTCALAARCPLVLAPAMNTAMWEHPATRQNLRTLKGRGAIVLDPASGLLACGDVGEGKLVEPGVIVERVLAAARPRPSATPAQGAGGRSPLQGRRILVTAGPTREPLDPVRFLSNPSSGKMGYAVAAACQDLGAEVVLVSGPVSLEPPAGVKLVKVETARQMAAAAKKAFAGCDALVAAAAVADYRPVAQSKHKQKKTGKPQALRLAPNPDILLDLSKRKGKRVLVGFAAETQDLLKNAAAKLKAKKLDLMVANLVGAGRGFGTDDNELTLLRPGRAPEALPRAPKAALAMRLAAELAGMLGDRG